jgi:hypothetical protein
MEVSRTSEGYDLDRIIEVLKPIVEPFPHVSIVREAEPIVYRSRRLSFFEDLVVIGSLWVPRYVVLLLALVVVVGAILLSANLILNH